jgi:hypothetical protein
MRADSRAAAERIVRARLGEGAEIELRDSSLREIVVALASRRAAQQPTGAAA